MTIFHFLFDNLILSWLCGGRGRFSPTAAYLKLLFPTVFNVLFLFLLPVYCFANFDKGIAGNSVANGLCAFAAAMLLSVLAMAFLRKKKFVEGVAERFDGMSGTERQRNRARWEVKGWSAVFAFPAFMFALILILDKFVFV